MTARVLENRQRCVKMRKKITAEVWQRHDADKMNLTSLQETISSDQMKRSEWFFSSSSWSLQRRNIINFCVFFFYCTRKIRVKMDHCAGISVGPLCREGGVRKLITQTRMMNHICAPCTWTLENLLNIGITRFIERFLSIIYWILIS